MNDLAISIIRTIVPVLVGAVAGAAAARNIPFDSTAVEAGVTAALTAVYYLAARLLEERWPQAGWLLGAAKQPTYTTPPTQPELEPDDDVAQPSDAPPEWLAETGAPGDALPEAGTQP